MNNDTFATWLSALTRVGEMYLNAIDNDPENEMLTLPEAIAVTDVRNAVAHAKLLSSDISSADAEAYCHRCGGPNIVWVAPSPLWNQVMRGGSIDGEWQYEEIICPICFAKLAEEQGIVTKSWRFHADADVELEITTPSGRIWNSETWFWNDPQASGKVICHACGEQVSLNKDGKMRNIGTLAKCARAVASSPTQSTMQMDEELFLGFMKRLQPNKHGEVLISKDHIDRLIELIKNKNATMRPYSDRDSPGRLDVNGVEWWACDPYPTWYRWDDGELKTTPGDWPDEK